MAIAANEIKGKAGAKTAKNGGEVVAEHENVGDGYVEEKYWEVQNSIQRGMDALARKRAFPLFG